MVIICFALITSILLSRKRRQWTKHYLLLNRIEILILFWITSCSADLAHFLRPIQMIAELGRMEWQRASGYNRRSLIEDGFYWYKAIIGRWLRARLFANQHVEGKLE